MTVLFPTTLGHTRTSLPPPKPGEAVAFEKHEAIDDSTRVASLTLQEPRCVVNESEMGTHSSSEPLHLERQNHRQGSIPS